MQRGAGREILITSALYFLTHCFAAGRWFTLSWLPVFSRQEQGSRQGCLHGEVGLWVTPVPLILNRLSEGLGFVSLYFANAGCAG